MGREDAFDYADPFVAKMGFLVTLSVIGGLVMLSSVLLLLYVLVRSSVGASARVPPLKYALAVNPPGQVPALLNGFGLWNAILLALIVLSYGYPIGQFFFLRTHAPPGVLPDRGATPMSRRFGPFRLHQNWSLVAVCLVSGVMTLALGLGLLVLPRYGLQTPPRSTWDALCGALAFSVIRGNFGR